MARRLNRGVSPVTLSKAEQEYVVHAADRDPELRQLIENTLGNEWDKLTFGQKLIAVQEELEKARSIAVLVQVNRARTDMREINASYALAREASATSSDDSPERHDAEPTPPAPNINGDLGALAEAASGLPSRSW